MRYRTMLAALLGPITSIALILPFAANAQAATAGQIQFRLIQYNTPGPDLPVTNTKLNKEFVTLKNTGTTSRNLTGWTVERRHERIPFRLDFRIERQARDVDETLGWHAPSMN